MVRLVAALAMFTALAACATVDRRLPWTAENVRVVGAKCGTPELTVDAHGLILSGLFKLGKPSPSDLKIRCLKRNIQLPTNFAFMMG